MNEATFKEELFKKGIDLSERQLEQFHIYYKTLIEWNSKMNLTAITDLEGVYLKHFYDSITAAFYYDFNKKMKIADVGAGAGFPSIPLMICFPHLEVSIVDSLNKRITFLKALQDLLKLDNLTLYHARAEEFGRLKEHRNRYDLVISRAVAKLPVLTELCIPLVKKEGLFVAMKGAGAKEEVSISGNAFKQLSVKHLETHDFLLPYEKSERNILILQKMKDTSKKYPRKAGTPNKLPL